VAGFLNSVTKKFGIISVAGFGNNFRFFQNCISVSQRNAVTKKEAETFLF